MVRFPSALRAPKRPTGGNSLPSSRRLLRRLLDENVSLMRELEELRGLQRVAHHDVLTGLPNRRLFDQRLREELSRAHRDATVRGSLIVVDVNDLKAVNDQHGLAAGDDVLREIADVVRGALRSADLCCRTGGDEFMILLPDTDVRGARLVMARLRTELIRAGARRNLPISMSAGSATWPTDGQVPVILVDKADDAMCIEKRRGKTRRRRVSPNRPAKLSLVK
jgi:diguanylate cyclase (GGDEF)-like protein